MNNAQIPRPGHFMPLPQGNEAAAPEHEIDPVTLRLTKRTRPVRRLPGVGLGLAESFPAPRLPAVSPNPSSVASHGLVSRAWAGVEVQGGRAVLRLLGLCLLLLGLPGSQAGVLPGNLLPNPAFELGTDLDQTAGVLMAWNRGGNAPTVCQVITNGAAGGGHALAVLDLAEGDFYGEWYSDVPLAGVVESGDTLEIQWDELYNLVGGEMRLSVVFFGAGDLVAGQTHFVTAGSSSPGWVSTVEDSSFTRRRGTLTVPSGAIQLRCSLVSGGAGTVTGLMVIDDLSVARVARPNLLFGNFWPNADFEAGTELDRPTGSVAGWSRGGSTPAICEVVTTNYASSSHALALIDLVLGESYGEWSADLALAGNAAPGDQLSLQWFELYQIAGGEMRLSIVFLDAAGGLAGETHFVTTGTTNLGWRGTVEASTFTKRTGSAPVPPGAVTLRCAIVSGGAGTVTGVMLIDDLSMARVVPLISGNLWGNPGFESGENLELMSGVPTGWNRGGSHPGIGVVTSRGVPTPNRAIAVVDQNPEGYGEWYGDLVLGPTAGPGQILDLQWSQAHGITNGEMRVTAGFSSAAGALISETHFVVLGESAGWTGALDGSPLVPVQHEVRVPEGAVRLRLALASAGPVATTGSMVIDDVSVSIHPGTILNGNLLPNPTFEAGIQMDNPASAMPAGIWARGGSDGSIDQVSTANAVSPVHALSLVDTNENAYGEWYGFLALPGFAAGDVVEVQWYQMHSTTNGGMRVTMAFTDAANVQLESRDFAASGESEGWLGSAAGSGFVLRKERLVVPEGTAKLRINVASGGASSVTGILLIDDLSVRRGRLAITSATRGPGGFSLSWESLADASYTVEFGTRLDVWSPLSTGLPSGGTSTTYTDEVVRPGNTGFYRVIQQ